MNGTYLKNPDDEFDYELELGHEFIVGSTTMIVSKISHTKPEFCLYILDGFLNNVEFDCVCENGEFFFI